MKVMPEAGLLLLCLATGMVSDNVQSILLQMIQDEYRTKMQRYTAGASVYGHRDL